MVFREKFENKYWYECHDGINVQSYCRGLWLYQSRLRDGEGEKKEEEEWDNEV